jgi:hypothetical protein
MTTFSDIPVADQADVQAETNNKLASANPFSVRDLENTTGSSAELEGFPTTHRLCGCRTDLVHL